MSRQILRVFLMLSAVQAFPLEPNYTLPPITYMTPESTMQRARDRGHRLMSLKGIPDGDVTLVCTNWACPTSIVVNAVGYSVVTNGRDDSFKFKIMTTNSMPEEIAYGFVKMEANGREARLSAFVARSYTSMILDRFAQGIKVHPIDPVTNMMFVTDVDYDPNTQQQLVYKNIHVSYEFMNTVLSNPATNALAFTAAIINAGLPEAERIPLPPAP